MKRYVMLAHVGANKPITPGDAERLIHAMEIGGDRWPKGDMKADFVNIEYGRDFLTETKKYDVVIIHSIFHCRQDWLQQAMDKGLISKHHSEENWRKRLESTDAQMIFLVKTLPSCLEGWHLWQIPGYKMAMPDHFVTIYHETEVSQEKELYIRVRVGRPEKKKKVQDAEGSEFDLHVWAKPETEYTSALYTISIVGGRAVSIDTPIDDTLQNIKELLEEPNNQR